MTVAEGITGLALGDTAEASRPGISLKLVKLDRGLSLCAPTTRCRPDHAARAGR